MFMSVTRVVTLNIGISMTPSIRVTSETRRKQQILSGSIVSRVVSEIVVVLFTGVGKVRGSSSRYVVSSYKRLVVVLNDNRKLTLVSYNGRTYNSSDVIRYSKCLCLVLSLLSSRMSSTVSVCSIGGCKL